MVPALTALVSTAAGPLRRLGIVYVPNGIFMKSWTPAAATRRLELTPILAAARAVPRSDLMVLSRL